MIAYNIFKTANVKNKKQNSLLLYIWWFSLQWAYITHNHKERYWRFDTDQWRPFPLSAWICAVYICQEYLSSPRPSLNLSIDYIINIYHSLGKFSRRQMDDIFLSFFLYFFFQKIGFDISCKLSPKETICMKCQSIFLKIIRKIFQNVVRLPTFCLLSILNVPEK